MIPSLANSAGWNWIEPDLDGEVGPVHLLPDAGQPRDQKQSDARRRDRVAVALEDMVVLDHQDRDGEEGEPDHEPLGLLARQLRVDPVDQHEPDPGEGGGEREHVRVGVRDARPDEQVRQHAQAEEERAVGERGVGDVLGPRGDDRREPGRHQQRHRQEPEQLTRARGHQFPPPASSRPRSSARTRSTASSRLRHSWSRTRARRAAGMARAGMPLP